MVQYHKRQMLAVPRSAHFSAVLSVLLCHCSDVVVPLELTGMHQTVGTTGPTECCSINRTHRTSHRLWTSFVLVLCCLVFPVGALATACFFEFSIETEIEHSGCCKMGWHMSVLGTSGVLCQQEATKVTWRRIGYSL